MGVEKSQLVRLHKLEAFSDISEVGEVPLNRRLVKHGHLKQPSELTYPGEAVRDDPCCSGQQQASSLLVECDLFLAERAEQLLLEPVIYALFVELVAAAQRLHHLARLHVVQADCAGLASSLRLRVRGLLVRATGRRPGLLVLEAVYGVDDLAHLLGRRHGVSVLVELLALLVLHLLAVLVVELCRLLLGCHGGVHLHVELARVEAGEVLWHSVEHELAGVGCTTIATAPTREGEVAVLALERLPVERHLNGRVALKLAYLLEDVVDVARDHRQVDEWLALSSVLLLLLLLLLLLGGVAVCLLLRGLAAQLGGHLHYVADVTQTGYTVQNLVDVDILVPVMLRVLASLPLPLVVSCTATALLLLALPLLLPLALALLDLLLLCLLLAGLSLLSAQLVLESLDLGLALLVKLLPHSLSLGLALELRELLVQDLEVRAEVLNLVLVLNRRTVVFIDPDQVCRLIGVLPAPALVASVLACHLRAGAATAAFLIITTLLATCVLRLERPGVLLPLALQPRLAELVLTRLPLALLVTVRLIALLIVEIVLAFVFHDTVFEDLDTVAFIGVLVLVELVFFFLLGHLVIRLTCNVDAARLHAKALSALPLRPAAKHMVDVLTLVLHACGQGGKLLLLLQVLHGRCLLLELILTLHVRGDSLRLPVLTARRRHLLSGRLLPLRRLRLTGTLVLLAVEELVADAKVLLDRVHDVREAIIVAIDLDDAGDERVDPVVVPDHLDVADDAVGGDLAAGVLREDLVVVARDVEVRDGVARADLDLAVVASQVDGVGRLGQSHAHAVVGNVDRVVRRVLLLLGSAATAGHAVVASRALRLLALEVHVTRRHSCLPEGRSELLREIY